MSTPHLHELAISAIAYDAFLVTELTTVLASRLERAPVWSGAWSPIPETTNAPLRDDESRIALILPQRLWGHDKVTAAEAEILRERAERNPKSVIVVTLDDEPLASWMRRLRHRRLATVGVDGASDWILDTIAKAGGFVTPAATPVDTEPAVVNRWPDLPTPYLRQPRAHSALRRELDTLCDALEAPVEEANNGGNCIRELQKHPNRFVARVDGVGVSFSWVPGRQGTVADGRLMVIEWSDIATTRGPAAFRTARATREQVYSVEAVNSDDWRWRADGPNGRASSTASLVGEWIDGATMMATLQRT